MLPQCSLYTLGFVLQLFHPLSALLVASTTWSHDSHMVLLRCITDSVDFENMLKFFDLLEATQLTLPMGEAIYALPE